MGWAALRLVLWPEFVLLMPTESLAFQKQMLDIANQIEGHPDNVAPAIYGGTLYQSK